jgi:hypothetical protein
MMLVARVVAGTGVQHRSAPVLNSAQFLELPIEVPETPMHAPAWHTSPAMQLEDAGASSTAPSQSSSRPLHVSVAPGWTLARMSSQSVRGSGPPVQGAMVDA